jgi:hypothetical protein
MSYTHIFIFPCTKTALFPRVFAASNDKLGSPQTSLSVFCVRVLVKILISKRNRTFSVEISSFSALIELPENARA